LPSNNPSNNAALLQLEIPEAQPVIPTAKAIIIPPDAVLYGTYINDDASMALISTDNEAQRWLKLKQYLNADFYLDGIFKDHVLIRDTGNTMSLEIRITNGGDSQELSQLSVPAMPSHARVESLPPVPGIDRVESNHYRIKRDLIMKELSSGEIFKQVKITQEEEGGFFIARIKDGSMAEIIGLHVGDTVHKINGKPLTNVMDVLDLYKNLDSLEKVDVEIGRMQQVQHLHYELN
jgi:type II secretory pathway component PulC